MAICFSMYNVCDQFCKLLDHLKQRKCLVSIVSQICLIFSFLQKKCTVIPGNYYNCVHEYIGSTLLTYRSVLLTSTPNTYSFMLIHEYLLLHRTAHWWSVPTNRISFFMDLFTFCGFTAFLL